MFRLCDDESLVSAVTTPDKPPSLADLEALEQCFQRGLLRCDSVDSNACDQVSNCDGHPEWEACADKGQYIHGTNEAGVGANYYSLTNTEESCPGRHRRRRWPLLLVVDRRHRVGRRLVPDLRLVRRGWHLVCHVGGELRALPGPVVRRRVITLFTFFPSPRVLSPFP